MGFNTIYGSAFFAKSLSQNPEKQPGDQLTDDDGFVRGVDFAAQQSAL